MNILILFELIFVCVRKVICHVAVSLFWQHDTTKGDEILTTLAVSCHAFFQFDLLDASRLSIVFKKLKSKIDKFTMKCKIYEVDDDLIMGGCYWYCYSHSEDAGCLGPMEYKGL